MELPHQLTYHHLQKAFFGFLNSLSLPEHRNLENSWLSCYLQWQFQVLPNRVYLLYAPWLVGANDILAMKCLKNPLYQKALHDKGFRFPDGKPYVVYLGLHLVVDILA